MDRAAIVRRSDKGEHMRTALLHLVLVISVVIANSRSQPVYYPLHQGNVWQFGDAQHQVRATGDTIMPDGHRYAMLLDTWYNVIDYQRQQGDSVIRSGSLLYDFSRSPGDTIIHVGNYVCVLTYVGVAQVLGRQLRQWTFGISWGPFTGEIDVVTDSLGVTLIQNNEPPWQKVLTGARIDGIIYGAVSSVKTDRESSAPGTFVLIQNYPNPFNPSTTITYDLPKRSEVQLTVYDMIGREVALLAEGDQEPGRYEHTFDGSNLASGVYLVRLKAPGVFRTNRMILLK